jgi:hypothetical protein
MGGIRHQNVPFFEGIPVKLHLILYSTAPSVESEVGPGAFKATHKLMDPRCMGMNGAFATKSPSGAKRAQEKSRRSLILVLMEVCCKERPIASATLMKRFAKRVKRIGSGALAGDLVGLDESSIAVVVGRQC